MTGAPLMTKPTAPPILILSRDADEYAGLLESFGLAGNRLQVAHSTASLPAVASRVTIALGEPDLLAEAAPGLRALRWAQSTWAGVTPLLPLARTGVVVTGVKGVFGTQMAEYVLGHMLSEALALPARRAAQEERRWLDRPTETLQGKRLGVMGTGSIGAAIAERCRAFEMTAVGYSLSGEARPPFDAVYGSDSLADFLEGLDVLVGVLPDTPQSAGLLDEAALRMLPPAAMVINVGRGSLLSEDDLLRVLRSGHLARVVLDVFEAEPLPRDHPFWSTPRLTITAHVAARSWPADIARIFMENLARFEAGRALAFQLDAQRGY